MQKKLLIFILFFLVLFENVLFTLELGLINVTLLRIFVVMVFVVYILSHLNRNKLYMYKDIKIILMFFCFWMFYIICSLIWTTYKEITIKSLFFYIFFYIIVYITIKLINNIRIVLKVPSIIFYITIILVILAGIEIVFGIHLSVSKFSDSDIYRLTYNIATGPFHNENNFSLFLSMVFPFILSRSIKKRGLINKILCYILLSSIILIIINNDARLILLVIVFQIITFVLIANISKYKKIMLSFFLIFFIGLLFIIGTDIINRFTDIQNELNSQSGSTYIRLQLIIQGLNMLYNSYLLGIGVDHFPELIYLSNIYIRDPHNWWIELLVEHGIIVFIGYICIYFWIIRRLYQIYKNNKELKNVAFSLLLTMSGLIIGSMAPSSLFFFTPIWLFIGLSLAVINVDSISKNETRKNEVFKFRKDNLE